jgi:penicillin-insensitive murein DD-endopeptidase
MTARLVALFLPLSVFAVATPTGARERVGAPSVALSIGSPTEGRLEGARELTASRVIELRDPDGAHWGLPRLVGMLERAAKRVNKLHEGSVLVVGDLSQRTGGEISGHKSHESGRDADVGFFFMTSSGDPAKKADFLPVDPNGKARQKPKLRFDDARNWTLVESFLTDKEARVEHIFVSAEIRARLLAYARQKGTYLPLLHLAALALKQPRKGLAHDDHFHVRIACPKSQKNVCQAESIPSAPKRKRERRTARR